VEPSRPRPHYRDSWQLIHGSRVVTPSGYFPSRSTSWSAYAGGMSAKAIAAQFGVHHTTVSAHLNQLGIAKHRLSELTGHADARGRVGHRPDHGRVDGCTSTATGPSDRPERVLERRTDPRIQCVDLVLAQPRVSSMVRRN
jgi:hypothetical protein